MGGALGGKGENHSNTKAIPCQAEYWVLTKVQTPIFMYHFSKSWFNN